MKTTPLKNILPLLSALGIVALLTLFVQVVQTKGKEQLPNLRPPQQQASCSPSDTPVE